jgi:hypothetical protein
MIYIRESNFFIRFYVIYMRKIEIEEKLRRKEDG